MEDNKIKILWLTDIHFSAEYSAIKGELQSYLDYFFIKVEQEENIRPFDYIFVTGDLAQAGTKKDYDELWKRIFEPLTTIFKNRGTPPPKIITIPGNHDVNWDESPFLTEYLNNQMPGFSEQSRNDFLKVNFENFKKLFADYSFFVNNTAAFSLPHLQVSEQYASHRLFGYVVDSDKGLIIILINSAWYSLGNQFNKMLVDKFQSDACAKGEEPDLNDLLKFKDLISEYNSQITGTPLAEIKEMQELFSKYADFVVVTCMHHPLNWLDWNEYYSYDNSTKNAAGIVTEIIDHSDLLLTGHEHVPVNFSPEKIFKDTILLKGGCFLFDNQHKKVTLKHNWFSVLEIDSIKGNAKESRYLFEKQGWMSKTQYLRFSKKNDKYPLTMARREDVLNKLARFCSSEKLIKYLKEWSVCEAVQASDLVVQPEHFDFCEVFQYRKKGLCEWYLIAKQPNFYEQIDTGSFLKYIDDLLATEPVQRTVIRFLVPDIHVDDHSAELYKDGQKDRYICLEKIASRADRLFDAFRHNFFIRFEDNPAMHDVFKKVQDLCFVNHIIPYWVLERNAR
ncbi:MAG: calcineurin-like phosphoesterase [Chitinophagaceae bacterium]|nr:calcineurin-like phosphoesterase [Chitinophagaceae bacterium]